jgi:plastocyanin
VRAGLPLLLFLSFFATPRVAAADGGATVRGRITVTAGGAPRRDASGVVVYVTGFEEPPPAVVPELRQKGRQFQPALLAITAGQSVAFPNGDPFFHNVFSLSPARRFDLGQFKLGESKEKQFPRPGVVEVYCNIHPEMAATILVLPNRRFATTAADGSFAIAGVPEGTWAIYAFERQAEKPARGEVRVAGGVAAEVKLTLDVTARALSRLNKYGEPVAGAAR